MATPAPHPAQLTSAAGPAEPVPVAFLGRTSTLEMQDPRASLRRQLRASRAWLPPGWFIAAVYWDIESGGLDLEARSQGDGYKAFADAGIPRDGGMADLLAEAASPVPRFAAVVCEDIERSGRDTFNALKLEKKLSRQGIPLFATDEPAFIDGVNATTVLVRRVKQGVAEWFRLQLKEKTWKGLVEHSLDGWNIGYAPYGYLAARQPHPVPVKASQGRTKTRLTLDPVRGPVVAQIFTWRVIHHLGMPAIAERLNADPARYPAPTEPGWTTQTIWAILGNPKYTGHMVYGRRRTRNGRRTRVPADQWLWSPEPVHPAIIDRATWHAAQEISAEHGTSRDGDTLSRHPAATRVYPYRGRVRCRDCRRRMNGIAYASGARTHVYYQCPHSPKNPRQVAASPGHPRTVKAPETRLDQIVARFFAEHVFGPGRAELLAAQLPATDADAIADRDAQTATLKARVRQLETAQNAQILALEQLPADPSGTAAAAMRGRITARFAELHADREHAETQLAALAATTPKAADPTLLEELPLAGDILPGLPADLRARLYDAFDLQILWNKPGAQATVFAEITDTTLKALPGILNPGQDGYDDTTEPSSDESGIMEDLFEPPITGPTFHRVGCCGSHWSHGPRRPLQALWFAVGGCPRLSSARPAGTRAVSDIESAEAEVYAASTSAGRRVAMAEARLADSAPARARPPTSSRHCCSKATTSATPTSPPRCPPRTPAPPDARVPAPAGLGAASGGPRVDMAGAHWPSATRTVRSCTCRSQGVDDSRGSRALTSAGSGPPDPMSTTASSKPARAYRRSTSPVGSRSSLLSSGMAHTIARRPPAAR
jgi:site-specific DNA recombinase